jgi:hypothetical protein
VALAYVNIHSVLFVWLKFIQMDTVPMSHAVWLHFVVVNLAACIALDEVFSPLNRKYIDRRA